MKTAESIYYIVIVDIIDQNTLEDISTLQFTLQNEF